MCGAMVARLTSIVIRYQKVAVSSTVTLIFFADFDPTPSVGTNLYVTKIANLILKTIATRIGFMSPSASSQAPTFSGLH